MEKRLYAEGTRLRYHIIKERGGFGYKSYCGQYISSYKVTERKPICSTLCKICEKIIKKDSI